MTKWCAGRSLTSPTSRRTSPVQWYRTHRTSCTPSKTIEVSTEQVDSTPRCDSTHPAALDPDGCQVNGSEGNRTVMVTLLSLFKVTGGPYKVSLNQNMYVQVDVSGPIMELVLALDTCVASSPPDDVHTRLYYLIRNG